MTRTTNTIRRLAASLFLLATGATIAAADALPEDPLRSPMWRDMAAKFFGDAKVVLDSRIKVTVPSIIEDQAQVPVTADARDVGGVVKLVVFADLNPIQHVLTLTPRQAAPYVSFRMKADRKSVV